MKASGIIFLVTAIATASLVAAADQAIGKSYYSDGISFSSSNDNGGDTGGDNGDNGDDTGYTGYTSGVRSFTGNAWGVNKAGEYAMMPTSECPYTCKIGEVCGTEDECSGGAVLYIIVGIFCAIALCFVFCFITQCCSVNVNCCETKPEPTKYSEDFYRPAAVTADDNEY